jgi:hypothetical protein
LLGGATGAALAWRGRPGDGEPAAALPAPKPAVTGRSRTLVLHGENWRLRSPNAVPGKLPERGDVRVPAGRLVDTRRREIGSFRAAALPGSAGVLLLHTFDLDDGTILGIGGNALHEATYAIVGGTGRFAGATGSYTSRQSPYETGGDGTAEFILTLSALEA